MVKSTNQVHQVCGHIAYPLNSVDNGVGKSNVH